MAATAADRANSRRAKRLTPTQIVRRRRARQARQRALDGQRRFWGILFGLLIGIGVLLPLGGAVIGFGVVYAQAAALLPPADVDLAAGLQALAADEAGGAAFYDASGTRLIDRARNPLADTAAWTRLNTLPRYVIEATLTAEDPDFFARAGFDLPGLLVDLGYTVLIATPPPDLSITGRLARSSVLADETANGAIDRAIELAVIAEIERRYTPEQILEWRLNSAHYGGDVYGLEAAAETYFGKRAVDLTLEEAALLAAIPSAPQYNPYTNEVAARGRGRDLLTAMVNAEVIARTAFEQAVEAAPTFQRAAPGVSDGIAAEYAAYARRQTEDILNGMGLDGARLIGRGGLRVVTALDVELYAQADCALRSRLAMLNGQPPVRATIDAQPCAAGALLPPISPDAVIVTGSRPDAGSVVIIDARTGVLRALVGTAETAAFQPAGTLQPFVYFEGFNGGLGGLYTPARMVLDIPQQFPGSEEGLIYTVSNLDGRFRGPMNLREAMGAGLLPPAADVAYRQGMSNILRSAHLMGLNSLDENEFDLMLLERGGAVAPLDLAYAYSVFAALGDMRGVSVPPLASGYRGRDPAAVLRIEDAAGGLIWSYDVDAAGRCATLDVCTPLLERGLAYLVNDVLADGETRRPIYGDSPLTLTRPAAVINAVSGDRVDHWTVGYTPDFVVTAHVSRVDRAPVDLPPFALDAAASVWHAVMEYAHARASLPVSSWTRPESIIETLVCDVSGLAPNGICPTRAEIFLDGTQRLGIDTYWQMVTVNAETGQLATVNTPAGLRTEARFFVPPTEALDWWTANNQPLPPTEVDTVSVPQAVSAARITTPENYSYVGGEVTIRGAITAGDLRTYQLAYGEGLNPGAWITLAEASRAPAAAEPLGTWDTTGLDGLYTLRLLLTRSDNRVDSTTVLVTVDNLAPTITLTTSEPGRVYRFPTDPTITVVADAADNLQVARVDFYHAGEFLGSDTSWPFSFDWDIQRPGTEVFSATVVDAVGGTASAEVTIEVLRAGS